MAISRGILSTDPQYKAWEKAFQKKEEKKSIQPVKKETRALTISETRILNAALDKCNKEIRKRYGLQNLPADIEIR